MKRSHSTFQSLFLHVLPGIVIFGFYVIAAPVLFTSFGVPRGGTILLGFMIVGMPLQLTLMKRQATAEGKKGIREVISFRQPQPFWLTIALVAVAFALAVGILATFPLDRISSWLADKVFWWFPPPARPASDLNGAGALVLATLVLQIIVDGIVNPIVEELYFRGFLLPRLSGLGWAAPVVNTALFTLAHLWQPYNYITIFTMVLPLTLITWWRRNIYVQMISHCLANTIGATISLHAYMQAH